MSDESEAYTPDEGTPPEQEQTKPPVNPDKAFIESAGHQLNGVKLHPYSPERMWAADAIGLRYGRLSKEAIEQYMLDRTYPGMAGDIPILMYVLSLQTREEVAWVRRNPIEAEKRAAEFAVKHGIVTPKQSRWWDAYEIFMRTMDEIHASYGEPETQKKTETQPATTAA